MLKKASSFVLASLKASTYCGEYVFGLSLTAALLGGLFEHPEGCFGAICGIADDAFPWSLRQFFNSLLVFCLLNVVHNSPVSPPHLHLSPPGGRGARSPVK